MSWAGPGRCRPQWGAGRIHRCAGLRRARPRRQAWNTASPARAPRRAGPDPRRGRPPASRSAGRATAGGRRRSRRPSRPRVSRACGAAGAASPRPRPRRAARPRRRTRPGATIDRLAPHGSERPYPHVPSQVPDPARRCEDSLPASRTAGAPPGSMDRYADTTNGLPVAGRATLAPTDEQVPVESTTPRCPSRRSTT